MAKESCGLMQKRDIRQLFGRITKSSSMLWFDVEKRYKTMLRFARPPGNSCGLMQKRDIRQFCTDVQPSLAGCGLMQKRDIRQS